jgi:uncharacterized membrane protein YbaN (DUF454 family)
MPIFKSTFNILAKYDEDEVYNSNWLDSNSIYLPPKKEWDYQRELQIEDVDIWEVLYEGSNGIGIYASWSPYAEFYLVTKGINYKNDPRFYERSGNTPYWDKLVETFYGRGAQMKVQVLARQLDIPINTFQTWVDDNEMWKHIPEPPSKKIILPN